jgi:hypothetical protein
LGVALDDYDTTGMPRTEAECIGCGRTIIVTVPFIALGNPWHWELKPEPPPAGRTVPRSDCKVARKTAAAGLWKWSYRLGNRIVVGTDYQTEAEAHKGLAEELAERGLELSEN